MLTHVQIIKSHKRKNFVSELYKGSPYGVGLLIFFMVYNYLQRFIYCKYIADRFLSTFVVCL